MTELSRRSLLQAAAAVGALAPGVTLIAPQTALAEDAPRPVHRWGLLVDATRCADGCTACVSACGQEHGLASTGRPAADPQWIRQVTLRRKATGDEVSIPVMCQHCFEAPCVAACPTGASHKRLDGIVLVEPDQCIGCRACVPACPYQARGFAYDPVTQAPPHSRRRQGTAEGCTLCAHRIDKGGIPACVEACPSKAITFGDLRDPNSEIARKVNEFTTHALRPNLMLDPGVKYQGI